jgi:hypothetical protein
MIAANESMLPILGLGKKLYPELEQTFIRTPDKAGQTVDAKTLREMWQKSSENLINLFQKVSHEDWLAKHNSVSEEDFAKEPHRNKLNVVLTRSLHQAYHAGQLALLQSIV